MRRPSDDLLRADTKRRRAMAEGPPREGHRFGRRISSFRGASRSANAGSARLPRLSAREIRDQSRPGLYVLGYLLTPKAGSAPHPVGGVCIPGHGRGVDDVVGIDENGRDRTRRLAINSISRFRRWSTAWRRWRSSPWPSGAAATRSTRAGVSGRRLASRLPERHCSWGRR